MGRVRGFYFEEEGWGVEHLVAVAGNFLSNRLVLVGADRLLEVDRAGRAIRVDLARDEVRDGPSAVDVLYPKGDLGDGHHDGPTPARPGGLLEGAGPNGPDSAPRPKSAEEVVGYRVLASDGEAGHVENFLLDEEARGIRHVVVGTRGRYSAGKALLDPWWIARIAPRARTVHVGLTGEQIWGTRWCAGYEVLDPRGVRIGRAREISADGFAGPGHVRVDVGLRAGFLRPRTFVVPAQTVAVDGARRTLTLQ